MNDHRLKAKLTQAEDPWVERKESFQEEKICKTLVAFANSVPTGEDAAVLFIGASNGGNHPGIADADGLQKKMTGLAEGKAYPPITVTMSVLTIEVNGKQKEILAVQVPASTRKPHFTGGSFVRRGSETVRASDEQFRELVASQNDTVRKLQRHQGNKVWLTLRSQPSGLRIEFYNARLTRVDAHTTEVDTTEGYGYPFPTNQLEVTEQVPGLVKIVAPSPWAELEHMQQMMRRWAAAHHTTSGIPEDHTKYLVDQLLAYIRISIDVIGWGMRTEPFQGHARFAGDGKHGRVENPAQVTTFTLFLFPRL